MAAVYANSANQIAALKELYTDDKEYMKDLVNLQAKFKPSQNATKRILFWLLYQKTNLQTASRVDIIAHDKPTKNGGR